jgi:hypothetical protein
MQLGRGLLWIGGVAVIAVGALLFFGLDGTERKGAPSEVLGTGGSEAAGSSSLAEARTGENRRAATRKQRNRKGRRGRLNRQNRAPAGEATPTGEESSRAAAEQLRAEDRTAMGAGAPRPGTGSSGTRAGEGASDRPESGSSSAIEALLRAASQAVGEDATRRDDRDVAPRDDGTASGTPRPGDDEGDKGRNNVPDPKLAGVSVGSPTVMTCADYPGACGLFGAAMGLPGAMPVVADGIEGVLLPVEGGPDLVGIRLPDRIIWVPTEGVTNSGQLAAVVGRFAP